MFACSPPHLTCASIFSIHSLTQCTDKWIMRSDNNNLIIHVDVSFNMTWYDVKSHSPRLPCVTSVQHAALSVFVDLCVRVWRIYGVTYLNVSRAPSCGCSSVYGSLLWNCKYECTEYNFSSLVIEKLLLCIFKFFLLMPTILD